MDEFNKTVYIYWHQGWDTAPELQLSVLQSWIKYNPTWKIEKIDYAMLPKLLDDIDYVYDKNKNISIQALSDIVRLSLLTKYGGIWADSTMLCMQPLDNWILSKLNVTGFWMYHGNGANMDISSGPASWFICSCKSNYMITSWKNICDKYWKMYNSCHNYFWMDDLFKHLYNSDTKFKELWDKTQHISCEEDGQAHALATYGMFNDTPKIKNLLKNSPPYALKLWKGYNDYIKTHTKDELEKTNAYFAINLTKDA